MIRILAAAALLAAPQAASAQADAAAACLTREDVSSMMILATPAMLEGAARRCASSLPPTAFLRTGFKSTVERLRDESQGRWQDMLTVMEKLSGEKMPSGLTEDTTRSLVQDLIGAELVKEIQLGQCGAIDELAAALSPLPAQNIGAMFSAIMTLAKDDKDVPFRMCKPS